MPFHRVARHRVVGVQHMADDFIRAHLAAQALVVVDVGLHHAHPQRPVGGVGRGREHRQARSAVAGHQRQHGGGHRQRRDARAHAVAAARDRRGHALVDQDQQEGEAGRAADIGDLAQQVRRMQAVAEGVAQQLRGQRFDGDPGRCTGQRPHRRAVVAAGDVTHQREGQQLRLQQRRRRQQRQQARARGQSDIARHGETEPREHRRDEGHAHRQPAERGSGHGLARVEHQQPRHQRHEAEQVGIAALRVHAEQRRTGSDTGQRAPAGVGEPAHVQIKGSPASAPVES